MIPRKIRKDRNTKCWYTIDKSVLCYHCLYLYPRGVNEEMKYTCKEISSSMLGKDIIKKNVYKCGHFIRNKNSEFLYRLLLVCLGASLALSIAATIHFIM